MYTAKFIVKTAQTTNRRAVSLAPWPLTLTVHRQQYCSTLYVVYVYNPATVDTPRTVQSTNLLRRCFVTVFVAT